MIDPMSDPSDFEKYLQRFNGWRGPNAKLEVAEARAPLPPPFSEREFVVLNAMDPKVCLVRMGYACLHVCMLARVWYVCSVEVPAACKTHTR